jgi:Holliday junction resolvase RusA-like endonuclease
MPNLTLPLSPGNNRMWRRYGTRTVVAPEYAKFKHAVRTLAALHGVCEPLQGPVSISIAYHPKARKKETEKPLRRQDLDSHIKCVGDALIGIAYVDDYQVVSIRCDLAEPVQDGKLVVMWEGA